MVSMEGAVYGIAGGGMCRPWLSEPSRRRWRNETRIAARCAGQPRARGALLSSFGLSLFRPDKQTAENNRDEDKGGHITKQVTAMCSGHRLNRHDAGVHDARPHCEPD